MTTMQIDRAVIEQALEVLDEADTFHRNLPDQRARRLAAMTALRAALAQQAEPVQEPVIGPCEHALIEVLTERDDAEDYIDAILNEVLGPDRAEWSSAYGRADALEEVRERIAQMLKPSIDKAWNRFEVALAQQDEPVEEPVAKNATAQFDHAIGADRFKVVRGAFWWHVLIGDSTKEHGKFHSRAGAEQMAADLLREFRNGAFVQHTAPPTLRAALAQQDEPVNFVSLLREADEIVRGKPTWRRFIDGTPLSNDIAVWMTVFAQDVARRAASPQHKENSNE